MEKCYEYLGCDKHDCNMYERGDDAKCWEVEGTLCNHPGLELINKSKKVKCEYCIYYKAAMKDDSYK